MEQNLRTASFFSKLIHQSKKLRLPGFHGQSLYDVITFFFQQVKRVGITERTSAISFNFIMAIPPMIIFLCTLIPYLPISKQFIDQLHGLIRDIIPGNANTEKTIIDFIDGILKHQHYGLLSLGFLLALFYSSNAMMGIMRAFDKNYVGFKKRTGWQKRGTALRLTLILFVLIFISLLLLIMQGAILKNWMGVSRASLRTVIENVRWVVITFLFLASVSFIYRHAPYVHKKWRLINPGSILATVLMLLFLFLFSKWINHFDSYHKLYGSLGTLIIVMLMVYFNSLVLLIGFELNVTINSLKYEADERVKLQPKGNASS